MYIPVATAGSSAAVGGAGVGASPCTREPASAPPPSTPVLLLERLLPRSNMELATGDSEGKMVEGSGKEERLVEV